MKTIRTARPRAATAIAALMALSLPLLAACSDDGSEEQASATATTEAPASEASSEAPSTSAAAESSDSAEAEGDGGVKITADPAENLADGQKISVKVTGLDPEAGYYGAICAAESTPGKPMPDCTGERGEAGTQQWITQKDGGTAILSPAGETEFELTAKQKGQAVDCATQECVLKIFGDHTEGFEDVAETPVTFAS